jgi:hypothetical protein
MANYESFSNIIESSLIELQEIARYLQARENLE